VKGESVGLDCHRGVPVHPVGPLGRAHKLIPLQDAAAIAVGVGLHAAEAVTYKHILFACALVPYETQHATEQTKSGHTLVPVNFWQ
jgi:hypothetical protein